MRKIEYRRFAGADERFGPGSFQGQIGKRISVNMPDGGSVAATLVGAVVAEDGLSVALTLDLPEGTRIPWAFDGPMSLGTVGMSGVNYIGVVHVVRWVLHEG